MRQRYPNRIERPVMVIIHGESALAYWRTPPLIRDVPLAEARATSAPPIGAGISPRIFTTRCDATEALRAVQGRVLTDLKGIALPIHVAMDSPPNRKKTNMVVAHSLARKPPKEHLRALGNGLFVASPALALMQASRTLSPIALLRHLFELCGIYALTPRTLRVKLVLEDLMQSGALTHHPTQTKAQGIYGFEDERGRTLPTLDDEGEPLEWSPCIGRNEKLPSFWKRPALTTVEELSASLDSMQGTCGKNRVAPLLKHVINGSGSPLETIFLLFCCLPPRYGGEHWRKPVLNRRILFDQAARRISRTNQCYADCLWDESRTIVEVEGEAYHAESERFKRDRSRAAALESMDYSVINITYEQLNDLKVLESRLNTISRRTGMPLQRRTVPFLLHREALHRELFSRCLSHNPSKSDWTV